MSEDEQAIRSLVDRWHQASMVGDTEMLLSLMSDDVVFLTQGRGPMSNAEFAALSTLPPGSVRPTLHIRQDIKEIRSSGELACMWSHLEVSIAPPGAADALVRTGDTLTLFFKIDGAWKLARDANLLALSSR